MLPGQMEPMHHQRLQMMLGSKNKRTPRHQTRDVLNTPLLEVAEVYTLV